MITIKNVAIGLNITLLTTTCFAQQVKLSSNTMFNETLNCSNFLSKENRLNSDEELDFNCKKANSVVLFSDVLLTQNHDWHNQKIATDTSSQLFGFQAKHKTLYQLRSTKETGLLNFSSNKVHPVNMDLSLSSQENEPFFKNRRNLYSSMWAFTSLNYLYADLVGVMDKNMLVQYQAGVVDGVKITPKFLTVAAGFMQIPLANVFLPHIIKNEKTLRWVQIASGTIMTLVQSGTLFVGKPTPYYALFSAFEIAATTYISIDAIKWKPTSTKK